MDHNFRFRVAGHSDAEKLGVIGPAIYAESYGHMWKDAAGYADFLMTFGVSAVSNFIAREDTKTWLVESDQQIVGFLSLVLRSPDPVELRVDGAEVPRIYLLAPARGRGLGEKLFAKADHYAREQGVDHLWLDAMKEAPWAWQTYRRWGFRKIGETSFPGNIQPHFKPMVVMRRPCV